jgi:molecular chaperone GrpE
LAQKSEQSEEKDPKNDPAVDSSAAPGEGDSPFEERLRKLTAERDDLRDTLLRRQADFDNFRKRTEKERQQERHRGIEHLIEVMLPVLDAFDNALASAGKEAAAVEYAKGFELIRRQLWDVLSKQGLRKIESVGREFNPHFHHAIARVETADHADGTVVGELQPGYTFHERVLRPAMVRVAAEPAHSRDN